MMKEYWQMPEETALKPGKDRGDHGMWGFTEHELGAIS